MAAAGDSVWAGTEGGVVRWSRTTGTHIKYTAPDGLVAETVGGIVVDEADHEWFGTGGGVGEFFDSYRTRLPLVAKNAH
jgi:ligand-binding sensor domain-containing protein